MAYQLPVGDGVVATCQSPNVGEVEALAAGDVDQQSAATKIIAAKEIANRTAGVLVNTLPSDRS